MHWFVDTDQLQPEPNQYQAAEAGHGGRPWSNQNQIPDSARWSRAPDVPRRRRTAGHHVALGRRAERSRHWDDQDYVSQESEKRWFDREFPRRWVPDSNYAPEPRHPSLHPDNQYHRQWAAYPNQCQYEPSHFAPHNASRRDVADTTDDPSRWSVDPSQGPRRRTNVSNQSQWTNDSIQHSRLPSQFDARPSHNRRWAPISQRRFNAMPNVLTRPDTEGSFLRTRRWRADPSSHDHESPQIPVNYLLPPQSPQTLSYATGQHQQPVDFGTVLPQPPLDFGAVLPQQPAHYGAVLPQHPVDYAAALPQQPVDYRSVLPQQMVDYRAVLPQQPLDYRAVFPQHLMDYGAMPPQKVAYGLYSAQGKPQTDYGNVINPQTVNYAPPTVDYAAMPAVQGTDRAGATSAPPNLMWSSEIPSALRAPR